MLLNTLISFLSQVFVFVTISKFGALNCALIGLGRKILSLVLSFVLYGHTMNAFQTVGLGLAITAMIANFYEKVCARLFCFPCSIISRLDSIFAWYESVCTVV